MSKHNLRQHVQLRYTTDPRELGYADVPGTGDWRQGRVDLQAPPRRLLDLWTVEARRAGLNGGTFYALDLRWSDGAATSLSELRHMLDAAEVRRAV